MKKYTDQGKVDTRSGFGAGLVGSGHRTILVLCILFAVNYVTSCWYEPAYENEPKEDTLIFRFSNECLINGESYRTIRAPYYSHREYLNDWYSDTHPFCFIKHTDSNRVVFVLLSRGDGMHPLWCGDPKLNWPRYTLFFYVVGEEDGTFVTGRDYSSSDNVAIYYPGQFCGQWMPYASGSDDILDLNGFLYGIKVELLSSSFKFGYSQRTNEDGGVVDVLDFYYDFEEVIVTGPELPIDPPVDPPIYPYPSPAPGDTIRVTNGRWRQAISLYYNELYDVVHDFVIAQ